MATTVPLRIAISGPVGAGKSTLASALAKRLSLEIVPEDMATIIAGHQEFNRAQQLKGMMGTANARDSEIRLQKALRGWMRAHVEWFDNRVRLYRRHTRLVADRWEADMLADWLMTLAGKPDKDQTARLYARMAESAREFDLIVLLPPARHAVDAANEDGLKRETSPIAHALGRSLLRGLMIEAGATPLILAAESSVEDRVRAIEAELAARRAGA